MRASASIPKNSLEEVRARNFFGKMYVGVTLRATPTKFENTYTGSVVLQDAA